MKRLRLAALRLVGFHNYQDVTLPVKGDVFLIGANESGKTTVLDAIQLVLSAERHFIWNAGANPIGRRNEGRSLKGIVLRSDLSGAPRNESGVAWAGLEFRPADNAEGTPLTLLFGASVRSVDANVQKHGARLGLALDQIPLTEQDSEGRVRVLRREEVAERTGAEIRGQIGSFLRELESLFGGASSFDRVAMLWQLAKSYKDLAVRTRKLSDLFVEFLPAPDPEPFQQVRKGLQDAREIEEQLAELRAGRDRLRELADLLGKLNAEREGVLRLDYMLAQHERTKLEKQREQRQGLLARETETLRAAEQQLGLVNGELKEREAEQGVLRSSEAMGLVERLNVAEQEARREEEAHKAQQRRVEASQRDVERIRGEAADSESSVRRNAANLLALVHHLEACVEDLKERLRAFKEILSADAPALASDLHLGDGMEELRVLADSLVQQFADALRKTEEELKETEGAIADLRLQHTRLEHHEEVLPDIDNYAELLAELESRGLKASPLYRFLEPEGLQDADLARVEEFLGLDFLATLVPQPEHAAEVRRVVQERCPAVRVLDAQIADGGRLPSFLRCEDARVAAHVAALWHELEIADDDPEEGTAGLRIARTGGAFRAGARSITAALVPGFIGGATRAARRTAELERLDRALADSDSSRLQLQK